MYRQTLAAVSLLGLLVAGRMATRGWGASPGIRSVSRSAVSSFIMTIEGDSGLTAVDAKVVVGEAGFRRHTSEGGAEFSLELGSTSPEAAVLFATTSPGPSKPGIYPVDDEPGSPALHALILTGSPTRPTGVYRARSGMLTVRMAGGGQMEGSFELQAGGFTAEDPMNERVMISAAGTFLATER